MALRSGLAATSLVALAVACAGGSPPPPGPSADARAASIVVSPGSLEPAFASTVTEYFADAAALSTTTVRVTVTTAHPDARAAVNGTAVTSGVAHALPFASGRNVITVLVTAADGVSTETYTVVLFGVDFWVDAQSGSDDAAVPGDEAHPWKTLTHALATAGTGKTLKARPGVYDAVNGETFPLRIGTGQVLIGAPAHRGTGALPTVIHGYGATGIGSYVGGQAAVVAAATATLSGFVLRGGVAGGLMLVVATGDGQRVERCSFDTGHTQSSGGLLLRAGTGRAVEGNVFETVGWGIDAEGANSGLVIRRNAFRTMWIPVVLRNGTGVDVVENDFTGSGQEGLRLEAGDPTIRRNTFDQATGYTLGAIFMYGGRPVISGNRFRGARAVQVWGGQPDLGSEANPGGNDFSAVPELGIVHVGTTAISAVGNTWAHATPTLARAAAADVVVNATGAVTWAPGRTFPSAGLDPFTADSATLALWHLDDGGSGTLADASGNGRTLDESVTAYSQYGRFGTSLYMTAGRYCAGAGSMSFPAGLSVELWTRAASGGAKTGTLFQAGAASVALRWVASQLTFSVGDGATWTDLAVTEAAVNDLVANELWHQVVGTYDGAALRLYVDGLERAAAPATVAVAVAVATGYWLGGLPAGDSVSGYVDEVRISSAVRSAAAIAAGHAGR